MRLGFVARIMLLLNEILWARSLSCFANAHFPGLCGEDMAEVWFHPGFDETTGLTNVHFAVLAGFAVCAWIFEA